ncbi:SUMF1/EgtB/PvdO family nonheme iron enzyme [Sphaerospermopsis torques-reginae]|nr:SUMF1/EgtB/PvdO family nonheme iron enzyme [Sphaerospermopsis torques-reginae]
MKNPSLLNLFLQLREAGLPLTIDQYDLALTALSKNVDIVLNEDNPAIKRVLQTVWVKSRKQQSLFNQCWQEWIWEIKQEDIEKDKPKPVIETIPQPAKFTDEIQPPETPQPDGKPELKPPIEADIEQINPDAISSNEEVATAVKTKLKQQNYFPVIRQQLKRSQQQLTRKLSSNIQKIDVLGTVIDVSKRGFFVKPIFNYPKNKYREVVLLIDQGGSMTPFHPLCRQLEQVYKTAKVYYFHNSPTDELYHDRQCWQGEFLTSVLSKFSRHHTLVIIVSDAGAARGRTVAERWEETYDFLENLISKVKRIAWLNPLPRQRWLNTTAEEIGKINSLVPMFAFDANEFPEMVKWLLGNKLTSLRSNVETFHETSLQQDNEDNHEDLWDYGFDAKGRVAVFEKLLGNSHLKFAAYAAFPLLLTPDLLYSLWYKFFSQSSNPKSDLPWYAVADLLLSDLCQQVDFELYEMEREVRNELLKKLPIRNRQAVLKELSEFLIAYINRQVTNQNQNDELYQVQEWAALSYVDKGSQAAKALAQKLQQAYFNNNKAELVRLSSVIETLAEPLKAEYEPLLKIAQGYRAAVRGDEAGIIASQKALNLALNLNTGENIDVAGVKLKRPEINFGKVRLQSFDFPVITVNRRGEETKRETKQNYYFTEKLSNNVTLDMVYIPGGTFLMGSPKDELGRYNSESPQHQVTVQPFWMGIYPVTQAQWKAVVTQCPKAKRDLNPDPSRFKGNNLPVESISWYDAVEFCERLSRLTRKKYRLPSEAEWEYACRAGTTTPFHFGGTITGELANYHSTTVYAEEPKSEWRQKKTPVGSFTANAFGLYDMHGNVWEWCYDDWHEDYSDSPNNGSAWLKRNNDEDDTSNYRVLRGGSWLSLPRHCRSAYRTYYYPDYRDDYGGFRLVVSGARNL